jgi:serine/threonine protein kinase
VVVSQEPKSYGGLGHGVPALGTRIGPYTVDAVLGGGQFGVVVRATHAVCEGRFALKVMRDASPGLVQRLRRRELLCQRRVRHPNVVRCIEVLAHEGRPVLVLELVDGPDLHGFVHERTGLVPLDLVDALARGIVAGVRAVHAERVIHRDLKPANVLVAPGAVAKVSDFGLAKALGRPAETWRGTAPGRWLGTAAYMAPEQIDDAKNVDARADVFSLGCVLYELLTGARAFPQDDLVAVVSAIKGGRYTPVWQLRPDAPDRMVGAIQAALLPDRSARVPSCDELLVLWNGAARPLSLRSISSTSESPPTLVSRPTVVRLGAPALVSSRRVVALFAGGMLAWSAIAGAFVGAWWAVHG